MRRSDFTRLAAEYGLQDVQSLGMDDLEQAIRTEQRRLVAERLELDPDVFEDEVEFTQNILDYYGAPPAETEGEDNAATTTDGEAQSDKGTEDSELPGEGEAARDATTGSEEGSSQSKNSEESGSESKSREAQSGDQGEVQGRTENQSESEGQN